MTKISNRSLQMPVQEMKWYELRGPVPGELGSCCKGDKFSRPMKLTSLHVELDCLPKNDFLEVIGNFMVTEPLAKALSKAKLTGKTLCKMTVSKGEYFERYSGTARVPNLKWLKITGIICVDDFATTPECSLILSQRAFESIQQFRINQCFINEWHPEHGRTNALQTPLFDDL